MPIKLHHRKDAQGWERVVFAEVLIPDTPNVYGDYWTRETIKEAAYMFMREGFGIDVEHDNFDVTGPVYVIEFFLARDGDPDFIPGSWVVGMKIEDDQLWERVLNNDLNGYSYEALVSFLSATLQIDDDGVRVGFTEADLTDGHKHAFMVMVDENNRPISGGTDEENGHSHTISGHTVTDETDGHTHRFTLVIGKEGK
jgi:hypothetical protein